MSRSLFLFVALLFFSFSSAHAAHHHGGGILPYYRDTQGVVWLFIGEETQTREWCDFGGSAERGENQYETAAREGYEETRGVVGSFNTIKTKLRKARMFKDTNNPQRSFYALFMLELQTKESRNASGRSRSAEFYHRANDRKFSAHYFQEKQKVAWIRASDLLKAIGKGSNVVYSNGKRYKLRPFFLKIMRENKQTLQKLY